MECLKRVLHVVVNMNRGGAETLIMNIYRNIDRTKIQFDFLVHKKEGDYEAEISKLGGKIFRIPYVTDVGHFAYYKALRNFFAEHTEYKIVHSHMDCMSGLVMKAAKKSDIPMRISHSHNTKSEGNVFVKVYKKYIGIKILKNATHLLACSEQAAKWLFGKKSINAILIRNGVDAELFRFNAEARKKKRLDLQAELKSNICVNDDTIIVGHLGRFCHQKNHSFLIDVFNYIHKNNNNSLLLLVGDGTLQKAIKEKVNRLTIENAVLFLGVRSDVSELLQVMDALLFPSFHEGLPVSIIEAQASGLHCVVSDCVSKEVDIGCGLVSYLNLKEKISCWAAEVTKLYKREEDTIAYLNKSGYNISATTQDIQKLYDSGGTSV